MASTQIQDAWVRSMMSRCLGADRSSPGKGDTVRRVPSGRCSWPSCRRWWFADYSTVDADLLGRWLAVAGVGSPLSDHLQPERDQVETVEEVADLDASTAGEV